MSIDRRTFLQLLSTGALSAAFPPSIARALSIPAHNQTGTINDVEHIVIMMQETALLITTTVRCAACADLVIIESLTCPMVTRFGTSPTTMVICCRSIQGPPIWDCNLLRIWRMTGSDSLFRHRLAGHLETGCDSMSDPAIGTVHQPEQADLNQMATRQ